MRLCQHIVCVCVCARVCVYSDCPSHTPPPTYITQSGNGLGPTGAEKLAGALVKMTGLQDLYLVSGREGVGVRGGIEVSKRRCGVEREALGQYEGLITDWARPFEPGLKTGWALLDPDNQLDTGARR